MEFEGDSNEKTSCMVVTGGVEMFRGISSLWTSAPFLFWLRPSWRNVQLFSALYMCYAWKQTRERKNYRNETAYAAPRVPGYHCLSTCWRGRTERKKSHIGLETFLSRSLSVPCLLSPFSFSFFSHDTLTSNHLQVLTAHVSVPLSL